MDRPDLKQRLTEYERLMRLDKPIGTLLLLWPTLWAVWIAAKGRPDWTVVIIFNVGTLLMRSAGCVWNDSVDVEFDRHVKRTSGRPLPAGTVTRKEALLLALFLALLAFSLVLFLNWQTIALSVVALSVAMTYPYFKRFFAMPQAYLGIAFGFGIPMAFAAHHKTVHWFAWVLLAANILWAIAYDTEYAMVDRDDDIKIGIRTSALTFGRWDVTAVMFCYAAMLAVMTWVGWWLRFNLFYYAGLAVAAGMALYHYTLIRGRDRDGCFKAFLHNNWLGAAIFAGIVLNYESKKWM
jgi:4-hydroxybenzoate polyprenyltransferase